MMIRNGIDCSVAITKDAAIKLFGQGQTFAARYLVPETYSKYFSVQEAQIISDAGMDILSVFETTPARTLGGDTAGRGDAQVALNCAHKVGQTKGSAIYFTADFDLTIQANFDATEKYLRAAATVLGTEYEVGIYGEYDLIEEMAKRKACKYFWQTYAWSHGKKSARANVYQFKNGQQLPGVPFQVDLNNSFGGEGFWSLRKPEVIPPLSPAIPDIPGTDRIHTKANATLVGDGIRINGTAYIPARAVATALGMNVSWDEATKTVTITD